MSKFYLILFLLLTGCTENKPFVREYTELQLSYLKQIPVEQRVYIESCMAESYRLWHDCQLAAVKLHIPTVETKQDNTLINTAAGTAIGYGAAKILLGK